MYLEDYHETLEVEDDPGYIAIYKNDLSFLIQKLREKL
jgi:hypothetical protein